MLTPQADGTAISYSSVLKALLYCLASAFLCGCILTFPLWPLDVAQRQHLLIGYEWFRYVFAGVFAIMFVGFIPSLMFAIRARRPFVSSKDNMLFWRSLNGSGSACIPDIIEVRPSYLIGLVTLDTRASGKKFIVAGLSDMSAEKTAERIKELLSQT